MKKLTHSAAARAAAFILCLLCGLTALLCAAGYFMTRIDRDRTLPEPDSVSVYKNGIRVLLNNALQEERYTGEYPELPSGYSYVATDRCCTTAERKTPCRSAFPAAVPSESAGSTCRRISNRSRRLARS